MSKTIEPLTMSEAIDKAMKKYKSARRIAVENFVISCPKENGMHNALNLARDAQVYGWKQSTVDAIKYAMRLCGKPI